MKYISAVLCFLPGIVLSQTGTITGTVRDDATEAGLPGANVFVAGTLRGAITDARGEFIIGSLPPGTYEIVTSLIGYRRHSTAGVVVHAGETTEISIRLLSSPVHSEPVVVTASKRAQLLEETPVSVAVMDAVAISSRNSVTVDEALRYVPGVYFTESQMNIRGSSGYSRGVGSRVLMLLDGIPLMTGDTGEINFETIPVGQVERVEVVKGSSSALYGSSAIGGVVNVLTKAISPIPETRVKLWGGLHVNPSYPEWEWSDSPRMSDGQAISHSQRIDNLGFSVFGSRTFDGSYRQNDFRRRYNTFGKLTYDFSPVQTVTATANYLYQHRGSFLFWRDLDNALIPPANQEGDYVKSKRFNAAVLYRHAASDDFFYSVRGQWYRGDFVSVVEMKDEGSLSNSFQGEVQAAWQTGRSNTLTGGIEASGDNAESDLFGNHSSTGIAAYLQDDFRIAPALLLTGGVRLDSYDLDSGATSRGIVNPKLGLVYNPSLGSSLRASFGRGFRGPSIGEAFTSTTISGFPIIPNPDLQPETSLSYEIGGTLPLAEFALIDLAVFRSDYSNLIEGDFTTNSSGDPVVQFNNVTKARIQGFETTLRMRLPGPEWLLSLSYQYLDPKDLSQNTTLQYRPRHLFYASTTSTMDILTIGADFRYISRYEEIDQLLVDLGIIKDGDTRVPMYVADLRVEADFTSRGTPLIARLNMNNVFQYNYVEVIGNMAPIGSYVLVLEAVF